MGHWYGLRFNKKPIIDYISARAVTDAYSIVLLVGACLVLQGCGVSIEAKRIAAPPDGGKVPYVIPGQGISAALVRTEINLVQPISWTAPSTTPLGDIYDACLHACHETGGSAEKTKQACTVKKADSHVSFFRPSVRTVTVPDHSRIYQTSVSADFFQTSNVTVQSTSDGTLDDVVSKTTSVAYDAVAAAAKLAAGLLSAQIPERLASTPYKLGQGTTTAARETNCFDLAGEMKTLTAHAPTTLSCNQAKSLQLCIARDSGTSVEAEREARDRLFDQAIEKKIDHQLLAAAAANRADRITSAQSRLDAVRRYYGVSKKNAEPILFNMVKNLEGPEEFRPYREHVNFLDLTDKEKNPWLIESQQDISTLDINDLTNKLQLLNRKYDVSTTLPKVFAPLNLNMIEEKSCAKVKGPVLEGSSTQAKGDELDTRLCDQERKKSAMDRAAIDAEESKLGPGFRYRLPMTATVLVDVYDPVANKPVRNSDSLSSLNIIAQYGPIAALPSYFKGKGGHVHLKFWPQSGGLMTAEIGSTGVDASTITSVAEKFETEYKERQKKADAAAFKAGGADPEIEALRREKEKLELRQKIFELKSGETK